MKKIESLLITVFINKKSVSPWPMAFRFEELRIWQIALRLTNEVDKLARTFPIEERFSLASQIKKAGDSVCLNIAEGSTGQTIPEYKRFLDIALRSAVEVVACLFIADSRKYLDNDVFKKLYDEYEILCKMITKFRDSM